MMNTEQTIAAVMAFLGCMIGVAVTICVYASARRLRNRTILTVPDSSPQENLTAMSVMAMLTAYRCIQKGSLNEAKSSLAEFMATWCGMIARQDRPQCIPVDTLTFIRSECRDFPELARLVESRIQEWENQSIEQMIEEMESEMANNTSEHIP